MFKGRKPIDYQTLLREAQELHRKQSDFLQERSDFWQHQCLVYLREITLLNAALRKKNEKIKRMKGIMNDKND